MKKSTRKTKLTTKGNGVPAKRGRPRKKVVLASGTVATIIRPLTASGLKDVLWETLIDLRTDGIQANRADAIAAQAREILRTVKVQLQVAGQAKVPVSAEVIRFAGN